MAKRRINPSFGDITGTIGGLVHYTRKGKPLTRRSPVRKAPFTERELRNQDRLRLAQSFASAALADPFLRARYEQAAAGLDASAQNMAVSDFFHAPTITEVDVGAYTGAAGEVIRVQAEERRIGAAEVRVSILGRGEALLEQGNATVESDGTTWLYRTQKNLEPGQPLWITVTAVDRPGNRTVKTVRHLSGT